MNSILRGPRARGEKAASGRGSGFGRIMVRVGSSIGPDGRIPRVRTPWREASAIPDKIRPKALHGAKSAGFRSRKDGRDGTHGAVRDLRSILAESLAQRPARTLQVEGFRRAAVLISFLERADGPRLLFIRRSKTTGTHRGQIAFPGGRIEEGEEARDAALREAEEEVLLPTGSVEVLGRLDDYPSVSSYVVSPYVGWVSDPPEAFTIQESEVIEAFEVPVERLAEARNQRVEWWDASRMPPEAPKRKLIEAHRELGHLADDEDRYPAYFFDASGRGRGPMEPDERIIWGLTARILAHTLEILEA